MQRREFLLAVSAAATLGSVQTARAQAAEPIVTTRQGRLAGFEEDRVLKFLGVPFAQPPVGVLRWAPPKPMAAWSGVRPAKAFGPAAMQQRIPATYRTTMSEDCLYLNVWTTSLSRTARQPVLVWIHGGGFSSGSGSETFTDGANLSKLGATVVTINYRLNTLGFLNHPVLGGNFGTQDMIAALRWVHENIDAFGGDPSKVLIFGYSAGGMAVRRVLESPLAKGLVNRAVITSVAGEDAPYTPVFTSQRSRDASVKIIETLGGIDAARAASYEQIQKAAASLPPQGGGGPRTPLDIVWQPAPDGKVVADDGSLPAWPSDTAVMIANCKNEARYFMNPNQPPEPKFIEDLTRKLAGPKADEVLEILKADGSPVLQLEHVMMELIWRESTYASLERFSKEGRKVYYYDFERLPSGSDTNGNRLVFHGSDVYYIFGNLIERIQLGGGMIERKFDDTDRRISRELQQAYIEFAKTGVPKGMNGAAWPMYRPNEKMVTRVADTVSFVPYRIDPITRIMNPLRSNQ